jgi:hypothetical protein
MSGGFPAPSDGSIPATIVNGVDQIRLTQYHYMMYGYKYFQEITRGIAYGTEDSKFTTSGFLDITLANAEQFAKEEYQQLQTLIANKNLLIASGTANAITLSTRVIDDTPESGTYAKNAPLPLSFRDGLELDFVATANNTGAVTMSIPSFQGVSGALDIIKQDLTPLIEGDIKIGYRYTIICDQTNDRFILKNSFFRSATATTQGIAYANKPIVLTYNSPTVVLYSAGTFQFDDGSDSGVLSAGSIDLATNGIGGLDTGSIAINTTYFQHAYKNDTTGAFGTAMSTSPTTSTISGWTRVARIKGGILITNGSSQIIEGVWYKDGKFEYSTPIEAITGFSQASNTETLRTIDVPSGLKTSALLRMNNDLSVPNIGTKIFSVYSPQFTRTILSDYDFTNWQLYDNTSGQVTNATSGILEITTNTSAQVKTNAKQLSGTADANLTIIVYGWIDNID